MKPVISPLKLADHGADVANLQDALLLLIDKGIIQLSAAEHQSFKDRLSLEQQDQAYKDGTVNVISLFQQQPTGALVATEDGWTEVVYVLNERGRTLSAINLGTDHLASIDEKIGTLGREQERAERRDSERRGVISHVHP